MVNLFPNFFKWGQKSATRKSADFESRAAGTSVDATAVTLRQYLSIDPDLAANVRRFIDNALPETPYLIPMEGQKVSDTTIKNYTKQLSDVRFYKILRGAMYSLMYSGNAFLEVKFLGKKLKELYNIDPETITIKFNNFGDVVGYEQKVGEKTIDFTPEEIIHISIDHFATHQIGEAFLKPLLRILERKAIAESYLAWVFDGNKLTPLIDVKADNMADEDWERIVSQLHYSKINPDKVHAVNTFTEDKIELIKLFTTEDFAAIQTYIEKQQEAILTVLQVPPIISGTTDNSNRSNSEVQARLVFYNTIRAYQNLIAEELNYEMLRKLNWNNVRFMFPAIDQRVDIETLKLVKSLRTELGFTEEAIIEYMKEMGFFIPNVRQLFDPKFAEMQTGGKPENSNEFPSREPRDKAGLVKNEKQRIEDRQMGVSSDAN